MYCGHKLHDVPNPLVDREQTQPYFPSARDLEDEFSGTQEQAPQCIGGYRLLRILGSGGMGAVYEAEASDTGKRVAVKLLSSRLASSPNSVERFKQEGRLASQLAHPRCVFVLAADTDAGRPYIVMELMPGKTLKDVVEARGSLAPEEAIERILDVIDGLAEAHRVGMIHRDIKPSNCFVTVDDRVKVGDFGLSKSLTDSRDHHLTQSGAFLGTVLFASPEQIRGEALDYSSDVYSVCATLYYLLCGEAPYHHESATAALARAISEDPTSIREKKPDLSRGLEQIVMKGLERSRDRRWHSLEDLREALVNHLPSRRHPARPRALIAAYILDRTLISIFAIIIEVLRQQSSGNINIQIGPVESGLISGLLLLTYFSVLEGLFGATVGKWLLGLRVSRIGRTGPPGLFRAIVRTVVFHLMAMGVFLLPEQSVQWFGNIAGGVVGGTSFVLCLSAWCVQFRKKWQFRGIHDFVTHCHVTQQPLRARKLRLLIKRPTPLEILLPTSNLPKKLGSYAVRGRVAIDAAGEQIWVGEDTLLSRVVLIWLRPALGGMPLLIEASRPSRLRRLGSGPLAWEGATFEWTAFAAPLGGPLSEAIAQSHTLPWADARFLLEQLVDELIAAEGDGTLPTSLGLDQVWVEPNGRIQLLDCSPIPSQRQKSRTPMSLLREVTSLTLEGQARLTPGMVRAAIPPHAIPLMNKLFANGGYQSLAELHRDLSETQHLRPEVTSAIRAAQLGIQAAIVGGAILSLFVLTFFTGLILAQTATQRAELVQTAIAALAKPQTQATLETDPELAGALQNSQTQHRLDDLWNRTRAEAEFRRTKLFAPQRVILEQFEEHAPKLEQQETVSSPAVRKIILWAGAVEHTPRWKEKYPWSSVAIPLLSGLLVIPLGLVIGAATLRGGISLMLAGIALVRRDGRRATRRQCGMRAAIVWFPIALLLFGSAAEQIYAPEQLYAAISLWLIALALLPIYVVIAIRFPARAPQDRIVRTSLVPS